MPGPSEGPWTVQGFVCDHAMVCNGLSGPVDVTQFRCVRCVLGLQVCLLPSCRVTIRVCACLGVSFTQLSVLWPGARVQRMRPSAVLAAVPWVSQLLCLARFTQSCDLPRMARDQG